jgi:hypothetical protein
VGGRRVLSGNGTRRRLFSAAARRHRCAGAEKLAGPKRPFLPPTGGLFTAQGRSVLASVFAWPRGQRVLHPREAVAQTTPRGAAPISRGTPPGRGRAKRRTDGMAPRSGPHRRRLLPRVGDRTDFDRLRDPHAEGALTVTCPRLAPPEDLLARACAENDQCLAPLARFPAVAADGSARACVRATRAYTRAPSGTSMSLEKSFA